VSLPTARRLRFFHYDRYACKTRPPVTFLPSRGVFLDPYTCHRCIVMLGCLGQHAVELAHEVLMAHATNWLYLWRRWWLSRVECWMVEWLLAGERVSLLEAMVWILPVRRATPGCGRRIYPSAVRMNAGVLFWGSLSSIRGCEGTIDSSFCKV